MKEIFRIKLYYFKGHIFFFKWYPIFFKIKISSILKTILESHFPLMKILIDSNFGYSLKILLTL